MIDLLALVVLSSVVFMGWRRGTLGMALWGASLVAGSLAAAFLAKPAGLWLAGRASLPVLLALPIAGFMVAAGATALVRSVARRAERKRAGLVEDGWEPMVGDRIGGASLGFLCGLGIVLVAGWVANATGDLHGHEAEVQASLVGRAAGSVGEPVIRALAGEATGDALMASSVAYVMSNPERGKATLQALVKDPRVQGLARDPGFRHALAHGDAAALDASPALAQLASDSAFVQAARRVRLLARGDDPAVSVDELSRALTQRLGPLVEAGEAVMADPEVQAALADPALREALARGDLKTLLTSEGIDLLVRRITEQLKEAR
ncbi:MAG TPA: CvpA family protein [Longimicrobiales bacterium]|nr:CvpA family protein [Longimicrobiales bacterium]